METSVVIKPELSIIQSKIHEIRGHKVILDFELAEMYGTETKYLKRAVRSNMERFPSDFMFELTVNEWENLRCKFGTSSWGGSRYLPFAFTEQGVAMLASVLKSPAAIEINIQIVRAFVFIRQYASGFAELKRDLQEYMSKTDVKIEDLYTLLDELITHKRDLESRPSVGFVFGQGKNKQTD
ncbi:MAG: ORF6N domain-containing protein [Bacteroidales bacterium]|nr:ORF6N domain-containing protein [Bacteroidales bacterium]